MILITGVGPHNIIYIYIYWSINKSDLCIYKASSYKLHPERSWWEEKHADSIAPCALPLPIALGYEAGIYVKLNSDDGGLFGSS